MKSISCGFCCWQYFSTAKMYLHQTIDTMHPGVHRVQIKYHL